MKSCSTCGRWKSDAEFYPDRRAGRSRDGRHHACIECERHAARERARAKNVRPWYSPMLRKPRDETGRFCKRRAA
jgi:hypothetical protein